MLTVINHTGDKLPIMRKAVRVESKTNAMRLQWPVLNKLLGSAYTAHNDI